MTRALLVATVIGCIVWPAVLAKPRALGEDPKEALQRALDALEPDDVAGRLRLVIWSREQGLEREARRLMRSITPTDPERFGNRPSATAAFWSYGDPALHEVSLTGEATGLRAQGLRGGPVLMLVGLQACAEQLDSDPRETANDWRRRLLVMPLTVTVVPLPFRTNLIGLPRDPHLDSLASVYYVQLLELSGSGVRTSNAVAWHPR